MNYEQLCRRFRKAKPQDETHGKIYKLYRSVRPSYYANLIEGKSGLHEQHDKDQCAGHFASMVFNDDVMRERLPKDVYKSLRKTIDNGKDLDITVANAVANAMKDWAIEKGATHFTHWFQPMTGITAEKHDSFISPAGGRHASSWSSPARS